MRRLFVALALTFTLALTAACTPRQVGLWFEAQGTPITRQQAIDVSENLRVWRQLVAYFEALEAASQQSALVGRWAGVAECESGGNWSISTGNGFYGGLQFTLSSWRAVGGTGYPHHHSAHEQASRAERLKAIQGLGAWPHCGSRYRG